MLIGTESGVSVVDRSGRVQSVWQGGAVRKILPLEDGWVLLSDRGVFVSEDLREWEERNNGLPVKTLKVFEGGEKSFLTVMAEIKDLEVHPEDSNIMVCAVKDGVYLTRDGGLAWRNLGMPAYNTNGIKAVAVLGLRASPGAPGGEPAAKELTVFCSHGIYGVHYIEPDRPGAKWVEINRGLEKLETTDNPDEVADIAAVRNGLSGGEGREEPALYVSQTFRRRIYSLNWEEKTFEPLWSDNEDFGTVDSLWQSGGGLCFLTEGRISELSLSSPKVTPQAMPRETQPAPREAVSGAGRNSPGVEASPAEIPAENSAPAVTVRERPDLSDRLKRLSGRKPACAVFREAGRNTGFVSLSELWLFDYRPVRTGSAAAARRGLYLPVNHAMDDYSLKPYLDTIEDRRLDMVVIDMKDDYGRLRFTPLDKSLEDWGRVFWPVDIDGFLEEMKKRDVYTVARVVVFKDPEAAKKRDAKYAVWDGKEGKAWAGYYDTRRKKTPPGEEAESSGNYVTEVLPAEDSDYEILRTYYDERWVDPYAEEYWEYIALLSSELAERGFDEIQFDYIRFPTDGVNLGDARYRWRESGMDMDSAILSFLRHIRSRVKVPVSVDIYGANGWYRTGARTGQEVEMLSSWVDVICPMYYPSHFEQGFLAQEPPELRPERIYYQGTLRTARIARGKTIVRPWVQAFYLNVSYDRRFYNPDYVRREIEGTEAAGNGGYTYWNNSGRYADIPGGARHGE